MKVDAEFVNNAGPNNAHNVIEKLADSARSLKAVVAFATKAGVEAVMPHILRIAERGHVSIIVGLYQGITEPSALRLLNKAKRTMSGRLDVRISRVHNLHRKVYIFRDRTKVSVLVGSSNLSADGLSSEGEFNTLLSLHDDRAVLRYLPEFSKPDDWTVPLTEDLISEYESSRVRPQSGMSSSTLKKILKFRPDNAKRPRPSVEHAKWFRNGVVAHVQSETESLVERQTGWDKRGWDWCTIDRQDRFSVGDSVVMFDYLGKQAWATVVTVKGITRTAVSTPDGRFFFAFREDRRRFRRKKISKALFSVLAAAGLTLTKSKSEDTRQLSHAEVEAVAKVFKR